MKTRQPTGKPSWPIILLAGAEKAGKTYHAAQASASELVGRTFWVGVGEDDPDEYGAIDGARFEIVEHDGTYRAILAALTEAAAEPSEPGVPNLIVLDSATRLWDLLCDEQQAVANARAKRRAEQYSKPLPDQDATITMDQWNTAKQRWAHIIDTLRDHQGPSLVTARLDVVTVMNDKGEPTKDRASRVKAEKSLPFDVGAIVEMPAVGEAWLRGVRSLRFKPGDTGKAEFPDFTVDALWRRLGLSDDVGARSHSGAHVTAPTPHRELVNEIALLADAAGVPRAQVAQDYADAHDGQPINEATDEGFLEQVRDDLKAKSEEKAA